MSRTEPHITSALVSGITPEQARVVRAHAWIYVFECWRAKQEAAGPGGPDDAEDLKNDRTTSENYTQ
jgi:hypothetical protein